MSRGRGLTGNAADPRHVAFAARKERRRDETLRHALQLVLSTPPGRFVLWGLLERAGVYRSVWDASAKIHYNAGRQDFGHELLDLITTADEEGYLLMEREARARARSESREAAGVQTPAADADQPDA